MAKPVKSADQELHQDCLDIISSLMESNDPVSVSILSRIGEAVEKYEKSKFPIAGVGNGGAIRMKFECGCSASYWVEGERLKGGLSCCGLHESIGQTLGNITKRCPMLMTWCGAIAAE